MPRPAFGPNALRMRQAARSPLRVRTSSRTLIISGITKDSTGAILGGCRVTLYVTTTDVIKEVVTSDPTTGAYRFSAITDPVPHYVVAYKAGAPDVAGTTVNTLIGT